jgi:aspartyl-tRNA(Asn)/glutamyl-tRNA(Gln) amidotransferase subunit A
MTTEQWLAWARADAEARSIDGLPPLLDALASAQRTLRAADWNARADADPAAGPPPAETSRAPIPTEPPRATPQVANEPIELQPLSWLAPRLARGEVSAIALAEACLEQIDHHNPSVNAIVGSLADRARSDAARADRERAAGRVLGPLHGVPVTLKDLIDLEGVPTTAASRVREAHRARRDAEVTRRLRAAGAVIVGKTNLHEFAFGTTSEDSAFGPVRHPANPSRSPGGSSGGAAAATLAGMCVAAVGTDTGGSIRIPAAACGLVGLKPTFGEVPVDGVVPLACSLDHVGPIARSVADAWLMWAVLAGQPAATPRARRLNDPDGLRLVLVEPHFCDLLEPGVRGSFFDAIDRLRQAGIDVIADALPHAAFTPTIYLHTVMAEAFAYHGPTLDERAADYTPGVRTRLEMGRYVLGQDYVRAQIGRSVLTGEVDALLAGADALVLPALPMAAPRIGETTVLLGTHREPVRNATLRLTQLFDLTGHPAIALPIGEAEPGFRASLQLVGRRGRTEDLLATALACEQVLGTSA